MSDSNEKEQQMDAAEQEQSVDSQNEQTSKYEGYNEQELRELLTARDEEIEHLEKAVSEAKDARLRKAAELDNYRKRVQRERSKIYETAKAKAIEDFLEVNDDLQRTLEAAEDLDVNETFMDGVLMVAKKFKEVLDEHGVERIDEEGVPFDVDLHDAMMRQKPEDESIGSDIVLNVVEGGYRIGDRTIRHAKVIVSE